MCLPPKAIIEAKSFRPIGIQRILNATLNLKKNFELDVGSLENIKYPHDVLIMYTLTLQFYQLFCYSFPRSTK